MKFYHDLTSVNLFKAAVKQYSLGTSSLKHPLHV